MATERISLLSSQARVQVPWIKVTLGSYTFGCFDQKYKKQIKTNNGVYRGYDIQYPEYVTQLNITKINGQVNRYNLVLSYPVTDKDDPNFFEKVLSSVSGTREIIFSYGDTATPNHIYKNEKALITKVTSNFNLEASTINYTIEAVSGAALGTSSCLSFPSDGKLHKPSDIIKKLWANPAYGLQKIFTGMTTKNLNKLIPGDDMAVDIGTKVNISVLDYIIYLVSCMVPAGSNGKSNRTSDLYILTIHDDTSYEKLYVDSEITGPYFKIARVGYQSEHSDAYVIDIGYNTSTIVTNFSIASDENYAMLYDYQKDLSPKIYTRRINENGEWEDVYTPSSTTRDSFETDVADKVWWTKLTKFPINASITIQGLLRPATLMTYVRLNVIFPGGHKHIASGLYLITKQQDSLSGSGFRTTLALTKISGDSYY